MMFRCAASNMSRLSAGKLILNVSNQEVKMVSKVAGGAFLTKACGNVSRSYASGPTNTTTKRSFSAYALLLVPVSTFCMGTVRLRKSQKHSEYVDKANEEMLKAPIPIPNNLDELEGLDHHRFKLRGTFDHKNEVYVRPFRPWKGKACKESTSDSSKESSEDSKESSKEPSKHSKCGRHRKGGYEVIVPFKLADKDMTVLVNRGWVPPERMLPVTRPAGQVEGEVELVGIYRKPKECPKFVAKKCEKFSKETEDGVWHWKDANAMAKKLNTTPLIFEVTSDSSIDGGPAGAPTHLTKKSYNTSIFVLYGISAATALLWYGKYI